MKYQILKDFMGSQDGRYAEHFEAGTVAELSDYLAANIPPGWAREYGEIENKAIISDGSPKRGRPKAK